MRRPRAAARLSTRAVHCAQDPFLVPLAGARRSAGLMRARRENRGLARHGKPERFDKTEGCSELHALDRHHTLARGAADSAIVVVAGAGGDQHKSMLGVRRGMVLLAMLPVFVVAVRMLTDVTGRTVMVMTVRVAVQQVARGAGRQIDDRQQAGYQTISKKLQHGAQKRPIGAVPNTPTVLPTLRVSQWNCRPASARASTGQGSSDRKTLLRPGLRDMNSVPRGPGPDDGLRAN